MPDVRQICVTCRFWSQMVAQAEGDGVLKAVCLNERSQNFGRYLEGQDSCDAWGFSSDGAVDAPWNRNEEGES